MVTGNIIIGRGSPLRPNDYIIHVGFEKILARIKCIDKDKPHYMNRLFHVHKLVEEWKANMYTKFVTSWISCLDESMMIWTNKFGPGWVVLPGSPIPLGMSGTPYAVPYQWWYSLLNLRKGSINQRRDGNRSSRRDMEQLGG